MPQSWAQLHSLVAKVLTLHMLETHVSTSSNPGSPAFHPAPCLWPGKAVRDGPGLRTLHPHGKRRRAPGSWLRIGSAPVIAATWGVNYNQTEDFPLCVSLYI